MKLLTDLFATDYGLMSVFVIVFILVMAVCFIRLFLGKINEGALAAPPVTQGDKAKK